MANVKKGVPFIKKRFEYALTRAGYSKNAFSKKVFPTVKQPLRKLQKYMETQEIPTEILERIAAVLGVGADYLNGTYSYTRKELKKNFGSDFSLYFDKKSFDPDGYHIDTYSDYHFTKKQEPINEHFIAFLNSHLYGYYQDESAKKYMRFDFHDLDIVELYELMGYFFAEVESRLMKPDSDSWKQFIEVTKQKHSFVSESNIKKIMEDTLNDEEDIQEK